MRLQERTIRALEPPHKGNRIHFDDAVPGFGIRVTAADARAFVLNYRVDGRLRRYTIGRWPDWSATAARAKAAELRQKLANGEDPLDQKASARNDPTFRTLVAEYLERHASTKRSGARDAEYLHRDVLPSWGSLKAKRVTRADVLKVVDGKAMHAPIAANRLLACIRKVFNWGIERGLVENNPCIAVKRPGKEKQRDRVLGETEIITAWRSIQEANCVSEPVKNILRLILITAQRPGEIAAMEWSEIEGSWWTIPAEKAKNGLAHRVPLSSMARQIIASRTGSGRYVFESRHDRPIQVNALAHAVRRMKFCGLNRWTPHDQRRTAAAQMTSAGVARLVVKRLLNHAESDITAVYDRHSYDAEKQAAIGVWDRKLRALLFGETAEVVEFSR